MPILLLMIVAVVVLKLKAKPQKKRTPPLLYSRGELKGNLAVFPCGCRFDWAQPEAKPTICQAHRLMIESMVDSDA